MVSCSFAIAICRLTSSVDKTWMIHLLQRSHAWIGQNRYPWDAAITILRHLPIYFHERLCEEVPSSAAPR